MSAQGLEVIDHTVQLTHEWINELRERLDWFSSHDALSLMRVTMRQIRDHISHEEAAQLSAQLPLLIRGMFYEGWNPSLSPVKDRDAAVFLSVIEDQVGTVQEWRGTDDIVCVFELLDSRISDGEIADVKANLPKRIRDLWPD